MRHLLLSLPFILLLSSCKQEKTSLMVGVTAGPHTIIMQDVLKRAQKEGLNIKILEFNDFIIPNEALSGGDIDINSYQHRPFLDEQIASRGYKLKEVGKTILLPIRLYSKKYKNIQDIPSKAVIAIPNDPSNRGRALLLLQSTGLIKLKNQKNPTVLDIIENPKNLEIKEVEAPILPRILPDVAAAVINTDWMLIAGENTKKFLAEEKPHNNPYVNILVVRKGDETRPDIKKFLSIYQSQATENFVQKTFKGDVLVGFYASHRSAISGDDCCH